MALSYEYIRVPEDKGTTDKVSESRCGLVVPHQPNSGISSVHQTNVHEEFCIYAMVSDGGCSGHAPTYD